MRVLVISDIHANYTALEAVLNDAGQVDETWCLGDLVGYGPDPNAVVEQVREMPHLTCIMGNHDMADHRKNGFRIIQRRCAPFADVDRKGADRGQYGFPAFPTAVHQSARRSDHGAWQSARPVMGICAEHINRAFEFRSFRYPVLFHRTFAHPKHVSIE